MDKSTENMWEALVSDEEVQQMMVRFLEAKPDRAANTKELEQLDAWARETRFDAMMLDLFMAGRVDIIEMKDGDPVFLHPSFRKS